MDHGGFVEANRGCGGGGGFLDDPSGPGSWPHGSRCSIIDCKEIIIILIIIINKNITANG